ncbi:MAG: glycerate kinase [Lachnospiraceae bacterium]|nr:glycerate kinase [Lachnospiraceae bacterium]
MNILIAMDSFKGSIASMQAGDAVKEGILRVDPKANVIVRPLADGGEGTVQALVDGMGGELVSVRVTGSLGEKVFCEYGIVQLRNTNGIVDEVTDEHMRTAMPKLSDIVKRQKEYTGDSGYYNGKAEIHKTELSGELCAVIEIAGAAGLTLVPEDNRNPMYTTTYGVGEVIRDAIGRGCRRFIIGIGGSATNDGGVGMLQALGVHFFDEEDGEIEHGAAGLEKLKLIDTSHMLPELSECEFRIACDVDNPLCGENGCSAVFAPQKGASKEDIMKMDKWLSHYAEIVQKLFQDVMLHKTKKLSPDMTLHETVKLSPDMMLYKTSKPDENLKSINTDHPGDGAAGGLGFAFRTFLHGELVSGSRLIIEETGLKDYIEKADIIITGEGCLDGQTVMGKAPISVANLAKEYSNADKPKKVIAFAGKLGDGVKQCLFHGIDAYYAIEYENVVPQDVMKPEIAGKYLADTVEKVFRREGLLDAD